MEIFQINEGYIDRRQLKLFNQKIKFYMLYQVQKRKRIETEEGVIQEINTEQQ